MVSRFPAAHFAIFGVGIISRCESSVGRFLYVFYSIGRFGYPLVFLVCVVVFVYVPGDSGLGFVGFVAIVYFAFPVLVCFSFCVAYSFPDFG